MLIDMKTCSKKADSFMNSVKDLIELCGDDPERDGLKETPKRVLKAFLEYGRVSGRPKAASREGF